MDLQDRLARLKKSIETITSGLEQVQVGLTSVRQQLEGVRQREGPLPEEKREQTLTQIRWALIARLGDLEELTASVARAAPPAASNASPSAASTPAPTTASGPTGKWAQARAQGRYTLQLAEVHQR